MRMLIALTAVAFLAGCATFGGVKPKTPEEALVVAEYSFQSALRSIDTMIVAGQFTSGEAKAALRAIETAEASLLALRVAVAAGTADNALIAASTAATAVLIVLIQAKGGGRASGSGGGDPLFSSNDNFLLMGRAA